MHERRVFVERSPSPRADHDNLGCRCTGRGGVQLFPARGSAHRFFVRLSNDSGVEIGWYSTASDPDSAESATAAAA